MGDSAGDPHWYCLWKEELKDSWGFMMLGGTRSPLCSRCILKGQQWPERLWLDALRGESMHSTRGNLHTQLAWERWRSWEQSDDLLLLFLDIRRTQQSSESNWRFRATPSKHGRLCLGSVPCTATKDLLGIQIHSMGWEEGILSINDLLQMLDFLFLRT